MQGNNRYFAVIYRDITDNYDKYNLGMYFHSEWVLDLDTFPFEFYDKFDKWDWDKVPGVMRVSPRPETPGARDQIFSESPEPEPWMGPEPRPDPSYRDWGGGSHSLLVWRWPGADTGTCAASWASPSRSPSSSRVRSEYEDVVHTAPAQPVTFFELETCSLVRRFYQSQNIWKQKKSA